MSILHQILVICLCFAAGLSISALSMRVFTTRPVSDADFLLSAFLEGLVIALAGMLPFMVPLPKDRPARAWIPRAVLSAALIFLAAFLNLYWLCLCFGG